MAAHQQKFWVSSLTQTFNLQNLKLRDFTKNKGNAGCQNYDAWLCARDVIGASKP